MHIRPYQQSDLSALADVMKAANHTDTLSNYFRRDIDLYPFTDRRGGLAFVKNLVCGIGTYTFVMETDPWDTSPASSSTTPSSPSTPPSFTPHVIGYSMCTRSGTFPTAQRWRQQNASYYDSLNRWLMHLERDYYHKLFKSVHHTYDTAKFNIVLPLLSEPWDPILFAESWELNGLFVRPDWQRRGLGRKLMQWGMDRASEERVPLIVGGSALGGPAYRKAGFESIGVSGFGEFFDEMEFGGEEMQRWVWEPEGVVSVVEEAREKSKEWKREWMERREREREREGK